MESDSILTSLLPGFDASIQRFSRGCVGCYRLPSHTTAIDDQAKGVIVQHIPESNPSTLEDFWSATSMCDMDYGAVQSQRSFSLKNTSNRISDAANGAGSTSNPVEFPNQGFHLWTQIREQWVGDNKSKNQPHLDREPKLSWNATYDSLLGTNRPFSQPVPLSEMVDFLVDIWEQEGMYD